MTQGREKQITVKVRFIHAEQMFLYYLINIVSESNKKTKLIKESSIPLCSAETRNDLKPPETT